MVQYLQKGVESCTKIIVPIQVIHVTEATMRNRKATVRGATIQMIHVIVMKVYLNMIKIKEKTR